MKTYQIVLLDKITKETTKVQNFQESAGQNLKEKLISLQLGYCEDEKPTISVQKIKSSGKLLSVAIAESDCDYSYISVIKQLN